MEDKFERFMIGQKAALIRDGKCLIVELSRKPGQWELPGGRPEKGELREAALRREISEELGVGDFDILGVVDYEIWYTQDLNIPFCATVHLIKNNNDKITLGSESINYKWISEDEIDKQDYYWKVTPRFIKNAFKYKKFLE